MRKSTKNKVFTSLEKKSIFSISLILFFRMFSIFLLLPVFSILTLEMLVWEEQLGLEKKFFLIGLAFGIYGLTQCFLQIPFGMFSDLVGRKKIIVIGLSLFIVGNVLAAITDSIYGMIIARFLQGTGAISSTVFALIADLTRVEVRTRANAIIGISIGAAFASAFALATLLGELIGLDGIFWLIAFLSMVSLILLMEVVPNPVESSQWIEKEYFMEIFKIVWKVPSLRTISWGGFVCGVGLSSTFFLIPLILVQNGFERSEMWKIYLPMILLGGTTMGLVSVLADLRNLFKEVMFFGIILMLFSLVSFGLANHNGILFLYIVSLYLFFVGFNVFEPIFPSLVSRSTTNETKGTAMGVYNFAQFFGHFVGATLAGLLYHNYFFVFLLLLASLEILFFYFALSFSNPKN